MKGIYNVKFKLIDLRLFKKFFFVNCINSQFNYVIFLVCETDSMVMMQSTTRVFAKVKDGWSSQTRLKKNCLHERQEKESSPPAVGRERHVMHLMRVRISTSQVALDMLSVVYREQKLILYACDVYAYTREIVNVRACA